MLMSMFPVKPPFGMQAPQPPMGALSQMLLPRPQHNYNAPGARVGPMNVAGQQRFKGGFNNPAINPVPVDLGLPPWMQMAGGTPPGYMSAPNNGAATPEGGQFGGIDLGNINTPFTNPNYVAPPINPVPADLGVPPWMQMAGAPVAQTSAPTAVPGYKIGGLAVMPRGRR